MHVVREMVCLGTLKLLQTFSAVMWLCIKWEFNDKCCDQEFNLAILYELYTNKEKILVAKYFKNKCIDQKQLFTFQENRTVV